MNHFNIKKATDKNFTAQSIVETIMECLLLLLLLLLLEKLCEVPIALLELKRQSVIVHNSN